MGERSKDIYDTHKHKKPFFQSVSLSLCLSLFRISSSLFPSCIYIRIFSRFSIVYVPTTLHWITNWREPERMPTVFVDIFQTD